MQHHFPDPNPLITVEIKENIFILIMKHQDNRFSLAFMNAFNLALDFIEKSPKSKQGSSLVTISQHPKIFSNGLLLEEAFKVGKDYFNIYEKLLARILIFPMPTIAAINGHAFAGGFMLSFVHDYRLMRSDFGYLCMNEIDLGIPVTPGMASVVRTKIQNPILYRKMLLEGYRFGFKEAFEGGFVDGGYESESILLKEAMIIASKKAIKSVKNNGKIYQWIKQEMYVSLYSTLMAGNIGFAADLMNMKSKI